MPNLEKLLARLAFVALFCGTGAPTMAQPTETAELEYTFEIFSIPGQGQIIGRDINDDMDVVGSVDDFSTGRRKSVGFVRRGGEITLIDFPGSEPLNGTVATGINNFGQVVGRFTTASPPGVTSHGFTLERGVLEEFDVPDSRTTQPFDINNDGVIVGRTFLDSSFSIGTGFVREGDEYTYFRPEDTRPPFGIQFMGVNDRGNIVGRVLDQTGFRAFAILDGVYMPFSIPGPGMPRDTIAAGINNSNQIVGYLRIDLRWHGFLMDATGIYQIDAPLPPGGEQTFLTGINDDGFLVGAVGFNRFPVREVLVGSPCDEHGEDCVSAPRIGDPVIDFCPASDDVAPVVTIAELSGGFVWPLSMAPLSLFFEASDDDGFDGDVVRERVLVDGCTVLDGSEIGDEDGLLSDEELSIDQDLLCALAESCGFTMLHNPTLVVEAEDCAGNVGSDSRTLPGSRMLTPGACPERVAP